MIAFDTPDLKPPALVIPAKKRRKRRSGRNTAIVVGAILILDDGTRCQVTHFDQTGQPWCQPLNK